MGSNKPRASSGFTLIEVLVALLLTSAVVLLAHALLAEVSDAVGRTQAAVRAADRAGSRRAWLVRAFANVDVGIVPPAGFRGTTHAGARGEADQVEFQSRVRVGEHHEPRTVRLWLAEDERVLAEVSTPQGTGDVTLDTLVLAEGIAELGLDYLLEMGADARWVQEWVSAASAPMAVRWRSTGVNGRADTVLLYVGARG